MARFPRIPLPGPLDDLVYGGVKKIESITPAGRAAAAKKAKAKPFVVNNMAFKDRGAAISFMQKNPGWVGKRFKTLVKGGRGRLLAEAGFELMAPNLQNQQVLRLNDKNIWTYGVPKAKAKATTSPAPRTTTVPTSTTRTPTGPSPKTTKTKKGKTTPAGGTSDADFYSQVARLFAGMNPQTQSQVDPQEVMNLLYGRGSGADEEYQMQQRLYQQQLADLQRQQEWDTRSIQNWYGQVGQAVDTARGRNAQMTGDLTGALRSNVQGILESIGGSAAPGAGPVGATGQAGANTLAAIGAADSQYLADMQPLLAQEAAGASASLINQLAAQRRELESNFQQYTASRKTEQTDKAAQLALQIAELNNQAKQQNYSNRASMAETLAGLMLQSGKMSLSEQQAIMDYMAQQQALQYRAGNDQANRALRGAIANQSTQTRLGIEGSRSFEKRINAALAGLPPIDPTAANYEAAAAQLKIDPSKYWASPELMQYVEQQFQQQGLSLRDAQTRTRFVAAVEQYGVHVRPEWLKTRAR